MKSDQDVLTRLLLDPFLTADEAAREATARAHTAVLISELRAASESRGRKNPPAATPVIDGPGIGF